MTAQDSKELEAAQCTSPAPGTGDWWLYLIRTRHGHLYTGITRDVARRFAEHMADGPRTARSLRGKGPLTLVYREPAGTHGEALRRERQVKKLSRQAKEALIRPCTEYQT
ncbi:MAG: GIY-YIG nuclease family protein [Gammaproteobacteria bacterium]|nr:GIY-YIG nuclease family protein [Gammaproteobacteria bacterium]